MTKLSQHPTAARVLAYPQIVDFNSNSYGYDVRL